MDGIADRRVTNVVAQLPQGRSVRAMIGLSPVAFVTVVQRSMQTLAWMMEVIAWLSLIKL